MLHKMKLNESPFERIKNGTKTIEFRLYDEKRRQVKIGDKIEFSKLPDLQEKILVEVLDIYRSETFEKLFKEIYADDEEIKRKTKSMHQYYSHEQEKEYGVVGIKIQLWKLKKKRKVHLIIRSVWNMLMKKKEIKELKFQFYEGILKIFYGDR